jgi:hypothetical protein
VIKMPLLQLVAGALAALPLACPYAAAAPACAPSCSWLPLWRRLLLVMVSTKRLNLLPLPACGLLPHACPSLLLPAPPPAGLAAAAAPLSGCLVGLVDLDRLLRSRLLLEVPKLCTVEDAGLRGVAGSAWLRGVDSAWLPTAAGEGRGLLLALLAGAGTAVSAV